MLRRLPDRRGGGIDARNPAARMRERLREEAAAAADIKNAQSGKSVSELPDEHVTHVGKPWRRQGDERGEDSPFIPPRLGIVDRVIDGHTTSRPGPAHHLSTRRMLAVATGRWDATA